MWRNNVPGLRKTSSIAAFRNHGVNHTRWYSSVPSLPIADAEFRGALDRVLHARGYPKSKAPLGFAISGGVDSMALAALYTQARANDERLPPAHGFIVDHKARPESAEEAAWVAEQLRHKLSMDSTILQLQWPPHFDFSDLRRFETEARRLRYQALGTACRDKCIASLMVAHHADDQAETVLMRLANNRLRSGLQAMQRVEWIPECEGIHGVYHSGKPAGIRPPKSEVMIYVEQGGVQILRPLLGFDKTRLIATCEEANIPWAEDKTNQVQTLTSRNAIRHIYRNHQLPKVLSVESLVNVSLHMQKRVELHKAYAEKLFNQCLLKLRLQTGSLVVRFPSFASLLSRPIQTDADRNEARNNAYYLIKRVAEVVSPRSSAQLDTLAATISNIYPELADAQSTSPPSINYCVFGIWWRALDDPSQFPPRPLEETEHNPREWFLMRQLPSARELESDTQKLICPPRPGVPLNERQWHLFDGRFWITLDHTNGETHTIRLFTENDRHYIDAAEKKFKGFKDFSLTHVSAFEHLHRYRRFLGTTLSLIKPYEMLYTLPAVFRTSASGTESFVGFPTLYAHWQVDKGSPRTEYRWKVRYKKIEFGAHKPEDVIMPGIGIKWALGTKKRERREQALSDKLEQKETISRKKIQMREKAELRRQRRGYLWTLKRVKTTGKPKRR
ncbi:hypothetical protein T440DRAFT_494840 [Plenodomus tracheiphilus IPT5]|uniref:tRNA(Ile)-lysidine synthetase n=1 Tax=Plenodomus tracheiphilus IPT5 TaxID=1408161 RepID=A0A6A7BNC6_9PLEO|nr:hypothetical protein T440DRAFT_494840 [Plenodomus tracheiphilus IPT5]